MNARKAGWTVLVAGTLILGWFLSPSGAATKSVRYLPPRTIEICATGCKYTTLNAACAAETSTSAAPLVYYVHAGLYSSATQQTCSGEDYATIMGDGPATRIINTESGLSTDPNGEGAGDYGTIGMGTSTNWTIHDMYLKGHRTIYVDGNGTGATNTGGGTIAIYNMVMETHAAQPNEDCGFFRDVAAGTEYRIYNNRCLHVSDGFTNISGATKWYVGGNTFFNTSDTTIGQTGGAYAMQAIPSVFIDQGSTFILGRGVTGASYASNHSHWFNGGAAAGGDGVECTSNCYAVIQQPVVRLTNLDSNGDGTNAIAINVSSTGANLDFLDIYDADVRVSTTDTTTGATYGIYVANATTAISVSGGKWRTSGGLTNTDFNASATSNGQIVLNNVDYETGTSDDLSTTDVRRMRASFRSYFGDGANTGTAFLNVPSNNSPVGISLHNLDAVNSEGSPSIEVINSTAAGGHKWQMYADSNDHFILSDATNAVIPLEFYPNLSFAVLKGFLAIFVDGGGMSIGAGGASDSGRIDFDSANDASITWKSSTKALQFTTGGGIQPDCVTTMPTCDAAAKGLIVCDSDGTVGLCLCNGAAFVAFGGAADCS